MENHSMKFEDCGSNKTQDNQWKLFSQLKATVTLTFDLLNLKAIEE